MKKNILYTTTLILCFTFASMSSMAWGKESKHVLKYEDFKSYVEYFNRMEDENIVQAIPNNEAWDWMKKNVPLFECPQDNFEEMFIYRWWTLRKHIKETPVGYAFTEFLV
nr:hypothetical protein [Prolixibacteraceae bacterium]